ncbi:MAG: 16S rRNA (cytidine(1402)-2'-O)-methyltransferase [Micrococcales bacterium]|nr:16S rRNA (cytidine(1402)-2'-O)-methyltransferase [Micrococcales bacterium]
MPNTLPTGLVLAATPLGDTRDASAHLLELLATADVVAAEDTRKLAALTSRLGVKLRGQVVSMHQHNEQDRSAGLLEQARCGLVVVVSDAGTPLISDPGFALVRQAIREGIEPQVAPGPSAVIAALVLSGLAADRFAFEGFLPKKKGRGARLAEMAVERRTMVLYESARRLASTLEELAAALGPDRPAAVCRELTKTHQEVKRGGLGDLAAWAAAGVLGEITLVVAGARGSNGAAITADVIGRVQKLVDNGLGLKEAVAVVAEGVGGSKRELYQAALAARPVDS